MVAPLSAGGDGVGALLPPTAMDQVDASRGRQNGPTSPLPQKFSIRGSTQIFPKRHSLNPQISSKLPNIYPIAKTCPSQSPSGQFTLDSQNRKARGHSLRVS